MSRSKTTLTLGAMAAAALVLAGCSSANDPEPTDEPTTPTSPVVTPVTTSAPDEATTVMVTETEFSIELSQDAFAPGTYTFEVSNEGGTSHNLFISGPGVEASTSMIAGGGDDSFTVTLTAGTYELWCSVGTHRLQGMDVTITVA